MKPIQCFTVFFIAVSFHLLQAQDILWEQTIGGLHSEYLYDMQPTPDYGYVLAGSSLSSDTGNKSGKAQGNLDYFIWKMDESGQMEWQKSYGGSGDDYLYSIGLTREGGFILGGSSGSPVSGDKKDPGFGNHDFWVLKLDPEGVEEWQVTLGGIGNDRLSSIQQTPDGGYIIGGSSDSSLFWNKEQQMIGNKSEESHGNFDYWVVKLTPQGEIEWERTLGGIYSDELRCVLATGDGYLVGGTSNSPESGNKSEKNVGMNDYWVIFLSLDGEIQWQNVYGGEGDETLAAMLVTENGYLLAGSSNSTPPGLPKGEEYSAASKNSGGVDTDFWVLEISKEGKPLWDNTYDFGKWDVLNSLAKAEDGAYLLGGYASAESSGRKSDRKGVNDYIALKINARGEILWSRTLGGKQTDQLKGLVRSRDGNYILAGNSDSVKSGDKSKASIGGSDYWVVKLVDAGKSFTERQLVEVYPNPTNQYANIVITEDFRQAKVLVFDLTGKKLVDRNILYQSTPVDLQGFAPGVYIFKIQVDEKTEEVKVIKKGSK